MNNFISRFGDKLIDGMSEFRFISINIPDLTMVMDPYPSWERVEPWEVEDAFKTIVQMGGTTIRLMPPSIHTASDPPGMKRHISALRKYDEDLWRDIDRILQFANQYNIRIVYPLIDEWHWCGGKDAFAALRGTTDFYGNAIVKQDFKNYIYDFLNRTNYYTGIQYKNDKAILCWETGNELSSSTSWTDEMAAYIKSVDSNHLVMDGYYGIDNNSLTNPNIDIVSNHYYPSNYSDPVAKCASDRNTSRGYKAFIVGEVSSYSPRVYHNLCDEVINNGTSGLCFWSLRFHSKNGGFYFHDDSSVGIHTSAYHWPGFPDKGDTYDEVQSLSIIRDHAFLIRGMTVPVNQVPEAPILLAINYTTDINWKGSVGATSYDVERATSASGPWSVVAIDVSDSRDVTTVPLFSDVTAVSGTNYYYRVKAKNSSGSSGYSNVIGPVLAANLLTNPGFEIGDESWHLGDHFSVSSEDKYTGGFYSVKLCGTHDLCNLIKYFTVTANTDYEMSFIGKCDSSSIVYRMINVSGQPITANNNTYYDGWYKRWRKYTIRFNSGNNTTVGICIVDGGGIAYFDNFCIRPIILAPTPKSTITDDGNAGIIYS